MTWLKIPWVPEDIFFLPILRCEVLREKITSGHRRHKSHFGVKCREKKITSGHRSYESHFHVILGSYISSNWFGVDVHVCFHWRWQLRFDCTRLCICDAWKKNCAISSLLRKESAIKNKIVTNSFPKKILTSSFKYIKRTEVSWEVHTLYVFRSQQDKKNFRSATLCITVPGQTEYCQAKRPCKQNIILLHFFSK